jgi:hypothetical protein
MLKKHPKTHPAGKLLNLSFYYRSTTEKIFKDKLLFVDRNLK